MRILAQVGVVFGVCLAGEAVSALLPAPFPASVIAMLLLFLLLLTGAVKPAHIGEKADFLLQNMSFFFIPAGVGVIEAFDAVKNSLLPLLAVCVLTTVITFAAAALAVTLTIRLQRWLGGRKG